MLDQLILVNSRIVHNWTLPIKLGQQSGVIFLDSGMELI